MNSWSKRAIDFDQTHEQADGGADVHLYLPEGFETKIVDRHALKSLKNLHGLCQGGYELHENFKVGLVCEKRGFMQSDANPCAFCKDGIIVLCYADDCLMFA